MRHLLTIVLSLYVAACSSPAKKAPEGPAPDDVPQDLTCCISPAVDNGPETRELVPLEKCAEDRRNPVDACNTGPGDNEPSM